MSGRLASLPFSLEHPVPESQRAAIEARALAANDRYVLDLLEKENFCPYARAGRERGRTERRVHFADTDSLAPIADIFADAVPRDVEVLQVIFPLVPVEPQAFSRFVNDVTDALNQTQPRPVFASAALHPHLPYRRETPAGLISLFRRAPDPTLQWVRLSTLDNIYRGRKGGTSFVDLNNVAAILEATNKRDLYEEIALANQSTAERLGIDWLDAHLAALANETQAAYRTILEAAGA